MREKQRFCSECGAPLEENDHFCPVCGAKVVDVYEKNHENALGKNASTPPVLRKSKPKVTPYVSKSSEEDMPSSFEEEKRLQPARFSYRIGAMLIDWSLIYLIVLASLSILYEFRFYTTNEIEIFFIFLIIVIVWIYNSGMESSVLQTTVGKYLFGLKVTNKTGLRCSFGCTTVRFITKLISLALGGLGYLMILFNNDKKALHDELASTLVVEGKIKVKFMKNLLKKFNL